MAAVGIIMVGIGVYLLYEAYRGNPHPVQKAKTAAFIGKGG